MHPAKLSSPLLLGTLAACAMLEPVSSSSSETASRSSSGHRSSEPTVVVEDEELAYVETVPVSKDGRRDRRSKLRPSAPPPVDAPAERAPPARKPAFEVAEADDEKAAAPATTRSGGPSRARAPSRPGAASPAPEPTYAPSAPPPPVVPQSPGVKAGAADDNLQFGAFTQFARENRHLGLPHVVEDRIVLEVRDRNGRPVPGARVSVDGQARRTSYADGRALLHPQRWGVGMQSELTIEALGQRVETQLGAAHGRKLSVILDAERSSVSQVPLDVAFVIDTTGSMGDEIQRLKSTLDVIAYQISRSEPRPQLRLGMVLFRDQGDEYLTRVVPFTSDLSAFERELAQVQAGGGGDGPEDVQSGLHAALRELRWRGEGVQLAFLVGDAAPHLDYGQPYTYVRALEEAATRGIKITTIGASGLDRRAELVWRELAQATMAPFVFLTYGEKGNSEGSASTVSHHVGSNWEAADLDAIIVRMVKLELGHYRDVPYAERKDYFSAAPHPSRSSTEVLEELFSKSMRQLVGYAVEPIQPRTPTVVFPVAGEDDGRLARRLQVQLSRTPEFQLLEVNEQQSLLGQIANQMKEKFSPEEMVEAGKLVPAQLAVLAQVDPAADGKLEMLLELVRLETGEVVSLSLLEIDARLVN